MIIVLSPAKSLDYDTPAHVQSYTKPAFVDDASELIDGLRKLSPQDIATLMDISDPLARLNFQRYADWSPTFTPANAKQAVLAFNGDVYEGFDAKSLSSADLDYAQQHVRVLSGLYGLLRPLDLLQPYRLEMGTRFANARGKDLYAFWGDRITRALNEQLETRSGAARVLVNCASTEYFQVGQAETAGRARRHAGVRGLEGRPLQDHQLPCEACARPDGAFYRREPDCRPEGAEGIRDGRLCVRCGCVERFDLRISPASRRVTLPAVHETAGACMRPGKRYTACSGRQLYM